MINIYEVIFKERGKKYYFKSEQTIEVDTQVIVETEKGEQFAKVVEPFDAELFQRTAERIRNSDFRFRSFR